MPTISVCLPAYNGERFIAEAIENVLAQSYADFELLVADDRSTDSTWAIVEAYAKKDSRIRAWRNESNKGLFANYNECIFRSSSPLIKLFAQDDLWQPTILERMFLSFEQYPDVAMIACNRTWIDEAGREIPLNQEFTETGSIDGFEVIRRCLTKLVNWIGEPSTVMFPKKFAGTGFQTAYYHLGDLEYWIRILLNGQFVFVNEPLCKFRRHPASTTNKNLTGLLFAIDMLRLVDACEDLLPRWDRNAEDLKLQSMCTVASYVRTLLARGDVSLEALLNQQPIDESSARRLVEEYKTLAFYSLISASGREEAWTARLAVKETELMQVEQDLANVLESRSWKSTSLLRRAIGGVNRICRTTR